MVEQRSTPKAKKEKGEAPAPAAPPTSLKTISAKQESILDFFSDAPLNMDVLPDDDEAIARHQKLVNMLVWQSYILVGMVGLVLFLFPVLRPTFTYYAHQEQLIQNPQDLLREGYSLSEEARESLKPKNVPLFGLDAPNVTKQALLSWAATGITEILTLGFGEYDKQIRSHRRWFTDIGWNSYIDALNKQGLRQEFLSRQLVLTTAPSDTPMIAGEGLDKNKRYVWYVSMPVIMNYITNNDVKSKKSATIQLEVIRVDPRDNPAGIAINTWTAF